MFFEGRRKPPTFFTSPLSIWRESKTNLEHLLGPHFLSVSASGVEYGVLNAFNKSYPAPRIVAIDKIIFKICKLIDKSFTITQMYCRGHTAPVFRRLERRSPMRVKVRSHCTRVYAIGRAAPLGTTTTRSELLVFHTQSKQKPDCLHNRNVADACT